MVTNYPHAVAHDDELAHAGDALNGVGVLDRVRQLWCGLHGHDNLLQFERDRMFLRCVSCGHETPGWELTEAAPAVTVRETPLSVREPVRPAMVHARLADARRIA